MKRLMMAAVLCLMAGTASAQERVVATYLTFISGNDIYNSRGERLTDIGAIIQQDRANYHRFGIRDADDNWDELFGQLEMRQQIPGLVTAGSFDAGLRGRILDGRALVVIQVYGSNGRLTGIGGVTPG